MSSVFACVCGVPGEPNEEQALTTLSVIETQQQPCCGLTDLQSSILFFYSHIYAAVLLRSVTAASASPMVEKLIGKKVGFRVTSDYQKPLVAVLPFLKLEVVIGMV